MDITFHATADFEKDLQGFPDRDRGRIVEKINLYCSRLDGDRAGFFRHVHQPVVPQLRSKLQSSLYSLRVSAEIRVIVTVDNDPLFDQILVTLLRVVRRKDVEKAFRGIAESLYQKDLASFDESKEQGDG